MLRGKRWRPIEERTSGDDHKSVAMLAAFHSEVIDSVARSVNDHVTTMNEGFGKLKSDTTIAVPSKLRNKIKKMDLALKVIRHLTKPLLDEMLHELNTVLNPRVAASPARAAEVLDISKEHIPVEPMVNDTFVLEDLPYAATDIITVPSIEDEWLAKAEAEKKAKHEADKKAKREAEEEAKNAATKRAQDDAVAVKNAKEDADKKVVIDMPDEQQAADLLDKLQECVLPPAEVERIVKVLYGYFKKTSGSAKEYKTTRHELWKVKRRALERAGTT